MVESLQNPLLRETLHCTAKFAVGLPVQTGMPGRSRRTHRDLQQAVSAKSKQGPKEVMAADARLQQHVDSLHGTIPWATWHPSHNMPCTAPSGRRATERTRKYQEPET